MELAGQGINLHCRQAQGADIKRTAPSNYPLSAQAVLDEGLTRIIARLELHCALAEIINNSRHVDPIRQQQNGGRRKIANS